MVPNCQDAEHVGASGMMPGLLVTVRCFPGGE